MRIPPLGPRSPVWIVAILPALLCPRADAADVEEDLPPAEQKKIRDAITAWSESIETISFKFRKNRTDSNDISATYFPEWRIDYARAPGGKKAVRTLVRDLNQKVVADALRLSNGRKNHGIFYFKGSADAISSVTVLNQGGKWDHHETGSIDPLAMLTPRGTPLADCFAKPGARLVRVVKSSGETQIQLRLAEGAGVICVLDPDHGWLTKELRFEKLPEIFIKATEFAKVGGHWFPVRGVGTDHDSEDPERGIPKKFEVTDLEINRPIPSQRFECPPLPDGVMVYDWTVPHGKRIQSSKRGLKLDELLELRRRYEAKYMPATEASAPEAAREPIKPPVAEGPPESSTPLWLGGLGSCLLIAAIVVTARGRRERPAS